jgi:hypothetical protein
MTWRHVLVYWVLAAIVGGLVYVGIERDAAIPPAAPEVASLVTTSLARIDDVTVRRGSATLAFGRESDRWVLKSPAGFRVTSDLVAALLDTLASIPPIERLSTDGRGSGPFGLSPPEAEVVLDGPDVEPVTVDIGSRNPTGTAVYAAVAGDDSVYLLGLNAQYYLELVFDEVARQRRPMSPDSPTPPAPPVE